MHKPHKAFANFSVGQVIHHKLFHYRGVIVDVDPQFQGSEQWYAQMARTSPPKDKPWYKVLVHNSAGTTYVAERNLEPDTSGDPVDHPYVNLFFSDFRNGTYIYSRPSN